MQQTGPQCRPWPVAVNSSETPVLSDAELKVLRNILAGLAPSSATGSALDALGSAPSLSDLKSLGFSRRDMVLWALDFMAQQSNLTTEQAFALKVARALLARDASALEKLLIEQLLPTSSSSASTQAVAP
jgi:hypothetical protein